MRRVRQGRRVPRRPGLRLSARAPRLVIGKRRQPVELRKLAIVADGDLVGGSCLGAIEGGTRGKRESGGQEETGGDEDEAEHVNETSKLHGFDQSAPATKLSTFSQASETVHAERRCAALKATFL